MPPPSSPNDRLSHVRFNLNSLNLISQYLNYNPNLSFINIPSQLRNVSMDTDDDYEIINDEDDYDVDLDDDDVDDDIDDDIGDIDDDIDEIGDDIDTTIPDSIDTDNETLYPSINTHNNEEDSDDSVDSDDSSLLNLYNMMYSDFPFGTENSESWHAASPETLLLSSARYNHHSQGPRRYPSNHYQRLLASNPVNSSTQHLPVALSRQNAIRRKTPGHESDLKKKLLKQSKFKTLLNDEAVNLFKDMQAIISTLNLLENHISPLFIMKNFRNRSRNLDSKDNLFLNLDDFMDDFLKSRKKGNIWLKKLAISHVNVSKKRKRKPMDTSNLKANKKQKLATVQDESVPATFDTKKPQSLFSNLTVDQKDAILDIQYCSIFTSGCSYILSFPGESNPVTDLIFTHINYDNKSIEGLFNIYGDTHASVFEKIVKFKLFIYGDTTNSNFGLPKQKSMYRKMVVLGRLVADSRICQNINKNSNRPKQITLQVSGNMIDFKERDLRFLSKLNKSDKHRIKTFHSSRLKSNGVRIQLSEWMRLEPFLQFKQSFLLTYMTRLYENLKNFPESKAPSFIKQETIQRAKNFRANIFDLVKDFNISDANLQWYQQDNILNTSRQERDYFLDDWRKSLAERLSDQLTNSTTTLLNIQLNYILFTLEINVSQYLDLAIKFILDSCRKFDFEYIEKYQKIYDVIVGDEAKYDKKNANSASQKHFAKHYKLAILLCSLNRKTGEIQIHNTLQFLNFKNLPPIRMDPGDILSRREGGLFPSAEEEQLVNDFESFSSTENEDEQAGEENRETYSFRPIDEKSIRKDPYEQRIPTELHGIMKRDNRYNAFGGGHPKFELV